MDEKHTGKNALSYLRQQDPWFCLTVLFWWPPVTSARCLVRIFHLSPFSTSISRNFCFQEFIYLGARVLSNPRSLCFRISSSFFLNFFRLFFGKFVVGAKYFFYFSLINSSWRSTQFFQNPELVNKVSAVEKWKKVPMWDVCDSLISVSCPLFQWPCIWNQHLGHFRLRGVSVERIWAGGKNPSAIFSLDLARHPSSE